MMLSHYARREQRRQFMAKNHEIMDRRHNVIYVEPDISLVNILVNILLLSYRNCHVAVLKAGIRHISIHL